MNSRGWWLSLGMAAGLSGLAASAVAQPAGMPDPRRMSGIARVDSGLEAGAISVRALLGTFAQPAVDTEITLELFAQDRRSLGTQTLRSDAAGRVTFRQLSQRYPELSYAIARASLGGEQESSLPIKVDPRAGSRVLLVKGASAMKAGGMPTQSPHGGVNPHSPGHGAGAGSPHGGGGGMGIKPPALCKPNPLDTHPPGTLVVGVIEFSAQGKLEGRPSLPVTLRIWAPGKEARTLEAKTDLNGRATFVGLSGEAYPEGTQFQVQAPALAGTGQVAALQAGARVDATVPVNQVRLKVFKSKSSQLMSERFVWGKEARVVLLTRTCAKPEQVPVQDAQVTLFRHSMTGDKSRSAHTLNAQGEVMIPIENHHDGDFYSLQANYQSAPFATAFFQPPKHAGVAAQIPVYEVTSDPSILRSAAQFEFYSREDNMAQVNRFYQVFVPGTKAFWRPGLKISGPDNTRWFKVVPSAESFLKHDEGAPFATLAAPLLPGKPVDLSVAFGVPHSETLKIEWTAPFPLERAMGVTSGDMKFDQGAQPPSKKGIHQGAKEAALSELDLLSPGARLCQEEGVTCKESAGKARIDLVVSGFAYERPWLVWAGLGVTGLSLLGLGLGWWLGRREDPRAALMAQRDELWASLQAAQAEGDQGRETQLKAQLNALYHRLESLHRSSSRDA